MEEGYLQTKLREAEDKIAVLQNTLTTLKIAVESLQRRTTNVENETKIVTDIDNILKRTENKLMSLNREELQKELNKIKEQNTANILDQINKKLKDYNDVCKRAEKVTIDFFSWLKRNNVSEVMMNMQCQISAINGLLVVKKVASSSEINKLIKEYRKRRRCNSVDFVPCRRNNEQNH